MNTVVFKNVSKSYQLGTITTSVLKDISFEIEPNLFTVISGPSGSGKTTILNLIGCLDKQSSGEIMVAGKSTTNMSDDEMSQFRLQNLGFIFQNFNLFPVLSAYENVEYPLILINMPAAQRKKRVMELLDAVGLSSKANNFPNQLSGGQRQRVAIARALSKNPSLVLADEPTANLDSHTGTEIIQLMRSMQKLLKITFIFSSHDPHIQAAADNTIVVNDGVIKNPVAA
jgi:putative ABC transport system ATP-binding protein